MSSDNKVTEILKSIVGELKEISRSQTIVGDPIQIGDKAVVPLVKLSVGFGAGGGQGEATDKGGGFGGGGGGGARIEPYAFIIMDGDNISMLSAKPGKLDSLIEAVPGLFGKLQAMRAKGKESKAADIADDTANEVPEG